MCIRVVDSLYSAFQKLVVGKIFKEFSKEVSYAHQECICLIKYAEIL